MIVCCQQIGSNNAAENPMPNMRLILIIAASAASFLLASCATQSASIGGSAPASSSSGGCACPTRENCSNDCAPSVRQSGGSGGGSNTIVQAQSNKWDVNFNIPLFVNVERGGGRIPRCQPQLSGGSRRCPPGASPCPFGESHYNCRGSCHPEHPSNWRSGGQVNWPANHPIHRQGGLVGDLQNYQRRRY